MDPLLRSMPPKVAKNNRVALFRRVVSFLLWMMDNDTATVEEVQQRFHIHRSTAYRWLDAWRACGNGAE